MDLKVSNAEVVGSQSGDGKLGDMTWWAAGTSVLVSMTMKLAQRLKEIEESKAPVQLVSDAPQGNAPIKTENQPVDPPKTFVPFNPEKVKIQGPVRIASGFKHWNEMGEQTPSRQMEFQWSKMNHRPRYSTPTLPFKPRGGTAPS